jgi:hypothetical protein
MQFPPRGLYRMGAAVAWAPAKGGAEPECDVEGTLLIHAIPHDHPLHRPREGGGLYPIAAEMHGQPPPRVRRVVPRS